MIFEWYWFPLFYLIIYHVKWALFTNYIHRGLCHRTMEFSNGFSTFVRWYLWTCKWYWPNWREDFFLSHNYHHIMKDTDKDPHNPRRFKIGELTDVYEIKPGMPYYVPPEFKKEYLEKFPHVRNFDDRLERFFLKYPRSGQWQLHIMCLLLFGPLAFLIGAPLFYICLKYDSIMSVIWSHGVYTCKWINYKSPHYTERMGRLAVNYFPVGILQAGEELHSNHHCQPGNPNFSHRWWELDMGYVYALLFEKLGWLKIKNKTVSQHYSKLIPK